MLLSTAVVLLTQNGIVRISAPVVSVTVRLPGEHANCGAAGAVGPILNVANARAEPAVVKFWMATPLPSIFASVPAPRCEYLQMNWTGTAVPTIPPIGWMVQEGVAGCTVKEVPTT